MTTRYTPLSWWQWIRIALKSWHSIIASNDREILKPVQGSEVSACIDCVTSWRHGTYGTVIKFYRLRHFVELSVSYGFSQLQFIDITTSYTINRLSLYCPNAFFLCIRFGSIFLTPFCLVIIINEIFSLQIGSLFLFSSYVWTGNMFFTRKERGKFSPFRNIPARRFLP
jgi:hypothetical protein